MSDFIDYYELLEVSPRASREVIELAYKAVAKKYHPDLNDAAKQIVYSRKMALINEAREVLLNDIKRIRYDSRYKEHYSDAKVNNPSNYATKASTNNNDANFNAKNNNADDKNQTTQDEDNKSRSDNTNSTKKVIDESGNDRIANILMLVVFSVVVTVILGMASDYSYTQPSATSTYQRILETTQTQNRYRASDSDEYIFENIISIPDYSWKRNESGVSRFDIDFRNKSNRTIQNITIKISFYDENIKPVPKDSEGNYYTTLLLNEPIKPNEVGGLGKYWGDVSVNPDIERCRFENVNITYTDGTYYSGPIDIIALIEE